MDHLTSYPVRLPAAISHSVDLSLTISVTRAPCKAACEYDRIGLVLEESTLIRCRSFQCEREGAGKKEISPSKKEILPSRSWSLEIMLNNKWCGDPLSKAKDKGRLCCPWNTQTW